MDKRLKRAEPTAGDCAVAVLEAKRQLAATLDTLPNDPRAAARALAVSLAAVMRVYGAVLARA